MRKIHILLSVVLFMAMAGCTSGGGDEASVAKYSANGTYAYSDRTLTMNWTNSDFLCNGPIAGDTNTKTEVAISATTMTWTDYRDRKPEAVLAAQHSIFALWREGKLNPRISATYPLEQYADALRQLHEGRGQGKVILSMQSGKET